MKTTFVETQNWLQLTRNLATLRDLSNEEPRIGVVCGRTGLGKTMAIRRYQAKNAYIYVRALDVWSPSAMLKALARELKGHEYRERAACFAECVRRIEDEPRHIIIDEADYLTADRHLLNTVRDLHDATSVSFVLVGEEQLPVNLGRVPHFWGRVARHVVFAPLTTAEVSLIARDLCGLDLADEQADEIREKAKGEFRWVKKSLRDLEGIVRHNKAERITPAMIEMAMRAVRRRAA